MFNRTITVLLGGDATVKIPKRCPKCDTLLDAPEANLQTFNRVELAACENADGDVFEDSQESWFCEEIQCAHCEHRFVPTADELRKAYAEIQAALDAAIAKLPKKE